jgi:hypothetical protein
VLVGHLGKFETDILLYSDCDDRLCGRVAAELSFASGSQFAVLLPHFKDGNVLSKDEWTMIAPGFERYHPGFQT